MWSPACYRSTATGKRLTVIPWFQGDKAGKTTQVHTFKQIDLCQDAFRVVYNFASAELRREAHMPEEAPAGRLLPFALSKTFKTIVLRSK